MKVVPTDVCNVHDEPPLAVKYTAPPLPTAAPLFASLNAIEFNLTEAMPVLLNVSPKDCLLVASAVIAHAIILLRQMLYY